MDANRNEVVQVPRALDRLSVAQRRALKEIADAPFERCREGWKTGQGRFVPLIVVAKLRTAGLVILDASKRIARPTLAAVPVIEALCA